MSETNQTTGKSETRIAIFLPSLSGGGAERSMLNLAHGFAECGYTVDLVLARAKGPYMNLVRKDVRLVDLKASRVLTSIPSLVRYLRREQPKAMISALNYANVVAVWARRLAGVSTRILVNEQNTITRSAHNSRRWRQRMVPHLVRRFYSWADYVIGNSQGVVEDLIPATGLPPQRIKMLYNPVVTEEVRERAQEPLDHPWFEASQPPVILAVGRLVQQKDYPTLIQAFAQVRKKQIARLMILGEGVDRPALQGLVNQLGVSQDVSMPGFVANPYAYMSRASLYVLSSRWEGLPTVLIEALYCGAPVIATDCPSGPREILDGGRHGLLVPMGDVPALAQAIEAGLAGNMPHPTEASWQAYSMEAIVNQYANLLLNGHH